MIQKVRAAWVLTSTWGPFVVITTLFGSVGIVASTLRMKTIAKRCMYWWAKTSCWLLKLTPELSADSKALWSASLSDLKQGVMIANHMSHLDILLIAALAPFDLRILAKASLFKIPFLGWYLQLCGHIPVYRGKQKHLNETKGREATKRALDEGATLFFFPEGTRSHDGQLKAFRSGAFMVAELHQLTTYPILIKGTSQLLRAGSRLIHHDQQRPCALRFLPELPPLQSLQDSTKRDLELNERAKQAKERAERLFQEAFTQH